MPSDNNDLIYSNSYYSNLWAFTCATTMNMDKLGIEVAIFIQEMSL